MKKIILSILVISMVLVLGLSLTACNNATPQGQLASIIGGLQYPQNHEEFVYDIFDRLDNSTADPVKTGTYTVKLDAYTQGSNVPFGNSTITNADEGILIRGFLESGNTIYETGCYYKIVSGTSFMVPAYSFRTHTVDGELQFDLQAHYEGSNFSFDRTVGEVKDSGKVKVSGAVVFDNNQMQQVLRSLTTFSSSVNLGFNMPLVSAKETTSTSLTASGGSVENVTVEYSKSNELYKENGIPCYKITISRSTVVSGTPQTLFYSTNDIVCDGWNVKNPLVKIVEPYKDEVSGQQRSKVYQLRTITIS